ncbi:Crp/Fnr family transcriptional regulator [Mangrovibacterium marinum]|uniref:CRP-like cAMP-binding protein n=1 Tax=Mangrovibacterium marinum TaxID=1639118 RepID=A0A2T5C026_9BACT|nr:Crp/Fnr family transcriptional regulator [Mangrovibacterium marinum]PTN07902.1 CRP-like cAMP-binding protein [Mangrovibacterium marinum]
MDTFQRFSNYCNQLGNFSYVDLIAVFRQLKPLHLKAGEYLSDCGHKKYQIGFLEEGIMGVRVCCGRGDEHLQHFIMSSSCFTDLECREFNKASTYRYQALKDCDILTLPIDKAHQLVRQYSGMWLVYEQLRHDSLLRMISYYDLLHQGDAANRYCCMVELFPELIYQLPMKYIAEFLGITPPSLSRIRRSYAH